jgi:large subunit ribosomal protein L35
MPKLKTNRSANKRYRITKNNKVLRRKAFKSHILEKKSPKQKRRLFSKVVCKKGDAKVIIKYLIGYKKYK